MGMAAIAPSGSPTDLHLCPGVAQLDRAVEHEGVRAARRVRAEIALPLELHGFAHGQLRQRGFQQRARAAYRHARRAGMDVQSHSHSHRVLNTLSPDSARLDLAQSAAILREHLGRPVHSVAYPVGYELEGLLRRAPADAQFALGFTNNTGLCLMNRLDPLNVPRVSRRHRPSTLKLTPA